MAGREGKNKNASRSYRPLRYFYLNGNLHKSLHINRGADRIVTWCYPLHKRIAYTYSDVKKNKEPAFTTTEMAAMLNRRPLAIERAILKGGITPPQYTYGLNENKIKYKYMWSEKDIMEAHEYFANTHYGRPRKDGRITPLRLPTARELRAMIRQETILYVKGEDGEFRPVWKAEDFD
jgi:hypothetical protein